jgi:small subunit ribosomal protein S15
LDGVCSRIHSRLSMAEKGSEEVAVTGDTFRSPQIASGFVNDKEEISAVGHKFTDKYSGVELSANNQIELERDRTTTESRNYGADLKFKNIFFNAPDLDIPTKLIEELLAKDALNAKSRQMAAEHSPFRHDLVTAVKKWRTHDNDVGSAEVQIAISNTRIKHLTQHLLANKKDLSTKRGLQALVVTRRKMLNNLYKSKPAHALAMAAELGVRFRPPGRMWDKQVKYGAFVNTKSKYDKGEAGTKHQSNS